MVRAGVFFALCMVLQPLCATEIQGRVVDATTREPIARVLIRDMATGEVTRVNKEGIFQLPWQGGEVHLQVSSVGYRPFKVKIAADSLQEIEIRLVPDTLRHSERVDVTAGPYGVEESPSALSLAGSELRNLASVLADDPLRAVQGLPGVNPNDDFQSQLSLRGAGFNRIGIFLDGILLHSPFHTLQADPTSASITVLSSDLLETAVLHPGAPPAEFGDRTVAAVDLRMRNGDRSRFSGRASASASNAALSLEGPFQRGRGSWLMSARKSYLQYVIDLSSDEPSIAFGFSDVQGRVNYDVTPRHNVTASLVHGSSGLDRSGAEGNIGLNTFFRSDYQFTLATLGSRWSPAGSLVLNNSGAWMRERYRNVNRDGNPLAGGHYGEWIFNSSNSWQWHEAAALLFGGSLRRLRDNGFQDRRSIAPPFVARLDEWRGTGLRGGVHLAQQFSTLSGRLQLRAGGRWDRHDVNAVASWSPSAAATFWLTPKSQVHVSWGASVQYPELSQFFSRSGSPALLAERANHVEIAVEQRFGERTRIRAGAWQRLDRDLLFRPLFEPRLINGSVYAGNASAPLVNSLRGYARGWQILVQRRTTNGLTGWAAYSYSDTNLRDGASGVRFPADYDQRHTANLFLSYRFRPTVNFSGRWIYGSGFPVRGFYEGRDPFLLSANRNLVRLPIYHRLDLRANKTFVRQGWHLTLFAEVINAYNRRNVRFDDLRAFDPRTGVARLGFDTLFPVVPSAGIAIEF